MAGAVSNLMVRAGFDGSQLSSGLRTMQTQVSGAQRSIGSTLGTIGKVAGAAVVAAGAALTTMGGIIAKVGVQYDMAQENSKIAWTTLLGSADKAKTMLTDIANFAKNTQFDSEGVDAMAKYLHNAGYEGKELFDRLTEVADVSGAFNIPAESAKELTRQMSQVAQAGLAYTEDLNILQDRGVPIYKAISKQLGITVGDVKMMASKGKLSSDIYIAAFDDIANSVKGASEAQSKTMSGMLSTLKDDFSIISGVLAKPLFEKLHKGMTDLMPLMDGFTSLARGDFKSFSDSLNNTFGASMGGKIVDFANTIKESFQKVKDGINGVRNLFKGGAENKGSGISMLSMAGLNPDQISAVQTAVGKIKGALQILKGSFEIFKGNSIGGITFLTKMGFSPETITKVVHVVNEIKGVISRYFDYIKGIFSGSDGLGKQWGKIFEIAKGIVMPIVSEIVKFVKEKFGEIKKFWDENGAMIIQAIKNVWTVITAIFKAVAPVILFILKMLWDNVSGAISGALDVIMGLIKIFAGLFTGNWSKMWEGVKQLFVGAIQLIWNVINLMMLGKILGGIKAFIETGVTHFTGFWTKVVDIFKNLDTYVWNIVKNMASKVLEFFRSMLDGGSLIFATLRRAGESIFKSLWGALKAIAESIFNSVVGFFKNLYTGAKGHVESLWNTAKTIFGKIKSAITDPMGEAKDFVLGKFKDIVDAAKNIPSGIAKGITGFMTDAISSIEDLAHNIVKKFKKALGINSPSKVFTEMGGHIISGLTNGLTSGNLLDLGKLVFKNFGGGIFNSFEKVKQYIKMFDGGMLKNIGGNIKEFFTSVFSGGDSAGGNVASWITQALGITGAPASWLGPLSTLVQKESGGNPNAINLWDSNAKAGHPSKGLFQTIDSTFNAYAMKGLGGIYNPIANAVAGIRYIMSRYGSVFNVPGIKSMMSGGKYKGYAIGTGYSPAGWAMVGENGPELMNLPRGTQIKSNGATNNLLGNGLADVISGAVANAMIQVMGTNQSSSNGDLIFNIDGRTFARAVKPHLDRENKRVGTNIRLQSI
jgi:tape measure domain-containing protein